MEKSQPRIDPKYIPASMDEQQFLEILRIDFSKIVREELDSFKKPDNQKILQITAKMFLLRKGFPVKLMEDPTGGIADLCNFLDKIGQHIINESTKENVELKTKARTNPEVHKALLNQQKQIGDMKIDEEKARDYFGETPEDFFLRTKIR
ncbi:MAG: hypothetical protein Q8L09_02345 [Candidatus Moranbacteria bacterium]|nr:hypothetical protein [Candidatus Moranbacteria bacterium]